MPTDLEAAIRDALRARADATVPYETAVRPRPPKRHLPLLAAAAAVVAVLALAIALVVARGSTHRTPAAGSAAFAGYRWNVVTVDADSGGTHVSVPSTWHAYIAFGRDGHVQADDALNTLSGAYRVTADGYTVHDMVSTAMGYDGRDPARTAVILALDSVLGGTGPHPTPVTAQVHGTRLTLTVPGTVVRLTRAGTAPDQAAPSTTRTSS
jgi:heat shock protein HslJ